MTKNRRLILAGLLSLLLASGPITVSAKGDFNSYVYIPNFNAADKARISSATNYLQSLKTAEGRFEQTDSHGRVAQGNWYLARPGKIRFEYDAPASLLIVSDGRNVSLWDPRLQSFDHYPLSETPLSLFLSRQIRFDEGVVVTEVTSNQQGFQLTARDRRAQVEGSVVMGFSESADGHVTLREWTITDAQNRATTVKLVSFTPDPHLDPSLFVINNPQIKK